MQFSLAVVATLLSVAAAAPAIDVPAPTNVATTDVDVPAPTVTAAAELPANDDEWTTEPIECPASFTVTNWERICPRFICVTPKDAPCTPMKTVTSYVNYQCTELPPTTTTVLAPCRNNCRCPRATVTTFTS